MIKFANVATPSVAGTVALRNSVPPTGLLPNATVTLPLNPVAMLPWASSAATRTAGAIPLPAVAGPPPLEWGGGRERTHLEHRHVRHSSSLFFLVKKKTSRCSTICASTDAQYHW